MVAKNSHDAGERGADPSWRSRYFVIPIKLILSSTMKSGEA